MITEANTLTKMATVTITTMHEAEADLLALGQWLSPAFPVGAFAYSHGLEWAIAADEVVDAQSLHTWIRDVLRFGAGRTDAILLVQAIRGEVSLAELADWAVAIAASAERERESVEQGAAFAATVAALTEKGFDPLPYPVAVGSAARSLALPARIVAGFYLQALASNLISAAVRMVPLGQTEGQKVLTSLRPLIAEIAADAAESPLEAVGHAAFRADLAAMRHETMISRMFRT